MAEVICYCFIFACSFSGLWIILLYSREVWASFYLFNFELILLTRFSNYSVVFYLLSGNRESASCRGSCGSLLVLEFWKSRTTLGESIGSTDSFLRAIARRAVCSCGAPGGLISPNADVTLLSTGTGSFWWALPKFLISICDKACEEGLKSRAEFKASNLDSIYWYFPFEFLVAPGVMSIYGFFWSSSWALCLS